MSNKINLYQNWVGIDEICMALQNYKNPNIDDVSCRIIIGLHYIDEIGINILNSYCSNKHPKQIDDFCRISWIESFLDNLFDLHDVMQSLLTSVNQSKTKQKIRLPKSELLKYKGLDFNFLEIDKKFDAFPFFEQKQRFLQGIIKKHEEHIALFFDISHDLGYLIPYFVKDQMVDRNTQMEIINVLHLDEVKEKYEYIESFFRGIHQISEIILELILYQMDDLKQKINSIRVVKNDQNDSTTKFMICPNEKHKIDFIRKQMLVFTKVWEKLAGNICLLSKMETGSYAAYRQSILGTSGAESVRLRKLHSIMLSLCNEMPKELRTQDGFKYALFEHPRDILLNHLLTSIRELQASTNDFWLKHFSLVMNTIGFIKGSQGLPVEKLLGYATDSMMSDGSLISVVSEVGNYYAKFPDAYEVLIDSNTRIVGKSIFAHVKDRFKIQKEYSLPKRTPSFLLDYFELRDLEPNDSLVSPYSKWFDIGQNLDFQTHSFGKPLNIFSQSIQKTTERLATLGNSFWQTFFYDRISQFKNILFRILDIQDGFSVNLEANVTNLINRLLSSLDQDKSCNILITNEEFLTVTRIIDSKVIYRNYNKTEVKISPDSTNIAHDICLAFSSKGNIDIVIISQVFSNLQISLTEFELEEIFEHIPSNIPIIIDITQGFCNVSINWGRILAGRKNVYLVGSCVKYARSTSGLSFLLFPSEGGILSNPKETGWCAYLSGLEMSKSTNFAGEILYDKEFQWFGGTPANVFALELFINSWDAILRKRENINSMNLYVGELHKYFLDLIGKKFDVIGQSRRNKYDKYSSSCLVLGTTSAQIAQWLQAAKSEKIYFDQRKNKFIRLGFGINHGFNEVKKLSEFLLNNLE